MANAKPSRPGNDTGEENDVQKTEAPEAVHKAAPVTQGVKPGTVTKLPLGQVRVDN